MPGSFIRGGLTMSPRSRILLTTSLLLLVLTGSAEAQDQGVLSPARAFGTMKRGQWIRVEGPLQQSQDVLCNQIKIISGALKDSAWSIRGSLRGIDPTKRQLTVGRYRVRLSERPKFDSPSGTLKSFSNLKTGMLVKVEGIYGKDGTFVA